MSFQFYFSVSTEKIGDSLISLKGGMLTNQKLNDLANKKSTTTSVAVRFAARKSSGSRVLCQILKLSVLLIGIRPCSAGD